MVERYLKIRASKPDLVRELLAFDTWSEWWPGVLSARVIQREPSQTVVQLVIKSLMTISMTLRFDHSDERVITFRQTTGWFKSYGGAYMLLSPPGKPGVTLKVSISADPGLLVPAGIIRSTLGTNLVLLEKALNERLKERARGEPSAVAQPQAPTVGAKEGNGLTPMPAKKLAHVFPTRRGWEVWIAGRRYVTRSRRAFPPPGAGQGSLFFRG